MATRTLDAIWSDLQKASSDYEAYCQAHAETEAAYKKLADRVRDVRGELGKFQEALPPCIDCGGGPAMLNGPQVEGADPATVLGDYKIICGARLPDQTVTLDDGTTQVIPGGKACRRIARGKTWAEALKRWDPVGHAK